MGELRGLVNNLTGNRQRITYLHADHLGSVAHSVNAATGASSSQEFDPWTTVCSGAVPQTSLNYIAKRKVGTGLLHYHACHEDSDPLRGG